MLTESSEVSRPDKKPEATSYGQILRSTSIVGGSQAINYILGMVRTKVVAVLLGPAGIGIVALYQSTLTLTGQLTGLGIGNSGVRQIAEAQASGNPQRAVKTVRVLRRACWFTGVLGWLVAAIFSWPLSVWAFDTPSRAVAIAILGVTLLFTAISGGQRALIQGSRRIGDLARMTVISAFLATVVAIGIYAVWGEDGIVPVLIVTALLNMAVSWWFARRVPLAAIEPVGWRETFTESKKLASFGFAFMWGGLLVALVDLGVRALVVRDMGLDGAGIYQATWALSGIFATFVLNAMGADFYPRLTGAANDNGLVNSMVNEQIEIGALIALPGLLATLGCGPLLLTIFYSREFVDGGAGLLPWFILGIYCRVISWPVGFVSLAKGAAGWFALAQTQFNAINFLFVWLLLGPVGLNGVGMAFVVAYLFSVMFNLVVSRRLSGFRWSASVTRLIVSSSIVIALAFASTLALSTYVNLAICLILAGVASVICVRGVANRVGPNHRAVKLLRLLPGARWLIVGNPEDLP